MHINTYIQIDQMRKSQSNLRTSWLRALHTASW